MDYSRKRNILDRIWDLPEIIVIHNKGVKPGITSRGTFSIPYGDGEQVCEHIFELIILNPCERVKSQRVFGRSYVRIDYVI